MSPIFVTPPGPESAPERVMFPPVVSNNGVFVRLMFTPLLQAAKEPSVPPERVREVVGVDVAAGSIFRGIGVLVRDGRYEVIMLFGERSLHTGDEVGITLVRPSFPFDESPYRGEPRKTVGLEIAKVFHPNY